MKTLAVDPITRDWKITDRRFTLEVRPGHVLALRVAHKLEVVKNEFDLAVEAGFPYFGVVLGIKNPDIKAIRARFIAYLEAIPGVALVPTLELVLDSKTRELAITGSLIGDYGGRIEILNGQVFVNGEKV